MRARVTLFAVLLFACGQSDPQTPLDECGPNSPCPDGYTCDVVHKPAVCTQSGAAAKVTLDIATVGMGTVSVTGQTTCASASCSYSLFQGSTASLHADPAAGWQFGGWTGDCVGSTPAQSVSLDAARSCTATFVQANAAHYDVLVSAGPGGSISTDAGLPCDEGTCSGSVATGTTVTLTATAGPGERFAGWTGSSDCDGQTASPLPITVAADVSCSARFVAVFTVKIVAPDGAAVTVNAGSCSAAVCTVDKGATATLVAGALAGARFDHWSGDAGCGGTEPMLALTISADTTCTANYLHRFTVTGVVEAGLSGPVTASADATASCGDGSCVVDEGKTVTLVAPTIADESFVAWQGCTGKVSGSGITVTATADVTCTAHYAPGISVGGSIVGAVGVDAQVTATATPAGDCADGKCVVDPGATVTLAAPDLAPANRFVDWEGDPGCSGTDPTLKLENVTASVSCTARFVQRVTVTGDGDGVTVRAPPPAVCSGAKCLVDVGSMVTVQAPAVDGHRFLGWSPGCGSDNPTTVKPLADLTCAPRYAQTVKVTGSADGADAAIAAVSTSPGHACDGGICTLDSGGDVTLRAPDLLPDDRFIAWTGDCDSPARDVTLTDVTSDKNCLAKYAARVTVTVGPEGATVTCDDPSADRGTGFCTVDAGQTVSLTPPAMDGKRFDKWVGGPACDGATDVPFTFAAGATVTCTATFVDEVTVTVEATGAPGATATVTSGACSGPSCVVDAGASVSLDANPVDGYRFHNWAGDTPCAGTTTPLHFSATKTTHCQAVYVQRFTVTGAVGDGLAAQGQVTASGDPTASCHGASCAADAGQSVTLVAPTIPGYRLTHWDDCTGTVSGSGLIVVASATLTCTARYALGVSVSGSVVGATDTVDANSTSPGHACGDGSCSLDAGGTVSLTAHDLLASGYRFLYWDGDMGCASLERTIMLTNVQSTITCLAHYAHEVTVTGVGTGVTVAADPPGMCSGQKCTVDAGAPVTLTAPKIDGERFTGWSAGCGTDNPTKVNPIADLSCSPVYATTVTVFAAASTGTTPSLAVSSTSPGFDCSAGTSCSFDAGGAATLSTSEQPPLSDRFKGWSGDMGCMSDKPGFTIPGVQQTTHCTANWVHRYKVTGVAPSGKMTATSTDPTASCTMASSPQNSCTVDDGQTVALAAPDIDGFVFIGWDKDACHTGQSTTVTPTADIVCTAKYQQIFTIAAVVDGTGGSVGASTGGAPCSGAKCQVGTGIHVLLTETPDAGYQFGGWTPTATCAPLAMDNSLDLHDVSTTCHATFNKVFTISAVAGNANGTVTATANGQACIGASCKVLSGTPVTLDAQAKPGFHFTSWSPDTCAPKAQHTIMLPGTADATCTAGFDPDPTFTASAVTNPAAVTTISASTSAGNCPGATCSGLPSGTQVTFTLNAAAVPQGYTFKGWSTNCVGGTGPSTTVTVTANVTCTATYQVTVGAEVSPGTGGLILPTGAICHGLGGSVTAGFSSLSCVVDPGTMLTFTLTPATGYALLGWSGTGCSVGANPDVATLVAMQPTTCEADLQSKFAVSYHSATGNLVGRGMVVGADATIFANSVTASGTSIERIDAPADSGDGPTASTLVGGFSAAGVVGTVTSAGKSILLAGTIAQPSVPLIISAGPTPGAVSLPFVAGLPTAPTDNPIAITASADNAVRVLSDLTVAGLEVGRLSTLKGGQITVDAQVFLAMSARDGCTGSVSSAPRVSVDVGSGTVVALQAAAGDSGFTLASVNYDGTLLWSEHIAWAGVTLLPRAATTLGSEAVIAGFGSAAGTGRIDGFYVRVSPTGNIDDAGLFGNATSNFAFGAVTATLDGGLALAGVAGQDAWLAIIDALGVIQRQVAYGGTGVDQFTSVNAFPDGGYLLGGTTTSFSGGSDVWLVRTDAELDVPFTAASGATTKPTTAAVIGSPTVTPQCVRVTTSAQAPVVIAIQAGTATVTATRQTP